MCEPGRPRQSGNLVWLAGSAGDLRLAQDFTCDLAEFWAEKGKASMLHTAEKQPAVFFATCARLLPNEVRVTVERSLPGNLRAQDWSLMREIVEAVKTALPDASSKPGLRGSRVPIARPSSLRTTPWTFSQDVAIHSPD